MAELVQMRQRIKAIETIKKITHAMRLISMSNHSRLKNKEEPLSHYQNSINQLFYKIKNAFPGWYNPVIMPRKFWKDKDLIILIGSQKGLCGTFNSLLFKAFESILAQYHHEHILLIAVGKKAVEYLQEKQVAPLFAKYDKFTMTTLNTILKDLTTNIMEAQPPFHSVTVVSNVLKTFFLQKPKASQILPLSQRTQKDQVYELPEDYVWEQPPYELLDSLSHLFVEAGLHHLLFQSLLAEQAARFLSMDNAMRNAEGVLEKAQLTFNKLRQTKITKELTELSGSY
jgi:F-type H+-transporting ATPase subunit gamma